MLSDSFKTSIRHYVRLFIFPILLISVVVLTYLPAMHSPTPHEVPVGIVGPAEMVGPLVDAFETSAGDQFVFTVLPDAATAREEIETQDISAALVLMAAPEDCEAGTAYINATTLPESQQEGAAVIYIAAAASPALASGGMAPLQHVAAQLGVPVMVRDLVPLHTNDQAGNGQMWFTLAVTLGAYVGVTMLSTVAKDLLKLKTLAVALPVYGVFMGLLASGLLAFVFDSLSMKLPLLMITAILNVMAVGLGAAVICRLAGGLSTLVVMFVFVGLGMTSSGAAIPVQLVPAFNRFFNPIMPYGATSRSVKSIMYFDNAELWQNWLVLGVWIVAMAAALWAIERWRPQSSTIEVAHTAGAGTGAPGTAAPSMA